MRTETQSPAPERRPARARLTRRESRARIVAAATELVRTRSYAELSVDAVMREAGLGRTIFYRHFDDLLELLLTTAREAIQALYDAQLSLVQAGPGDPGAATRQAFEAAVGVYLRHGPLLRCVQEAAAGDEELAPGYAEMRRRFDALAEEALRELGYAGREAPPNLSEIARALNRMNETYLIDTFGREPRVEPEVAVLTLTQIWDAVISR